MNNYSDEWYTPKYIFDALGVNFDMDVAAPENIELLQVPAKTFLCNESLSQQWDGFVWCNPPFSGKNKGKMKWIDKMYVHGNGIMLVPDRTSAQWWPVLASRSTAVLFVTGKIKFIRPDDTTGDQPANGTCLFAFGDKGLQALKNAQKNKLGILFHNTYPN